MAESDGTREFNVAELLVKLAADKEAPDRRAFGVLGYLQSSEFTDYDTLCFCIEFIAGKSAQMPWLADEAKSLVRKLYIMHVTKFKDLEWLDSISPSLKTQTEPKPASGT